MRKRICYLGQGENSCTSVHGGTTMDLLNRYLEHLVAGDAEKVSLLFSEDGPIKEYRVIVL